MKTMRLYVFAVHEMPILPGQGGFTITATAQGMKYPQGTTRKYRAVVALDDGSASQYLQQVYGHRPFQAELLVRIDGEELRAAILELYGSEPEGLQVVSAMRYAVLEYPKAVGEHARAVELAAKNIERAVYDELHEKLEQRMKEDEPEPPSGPGVSYPLRPASR